MKKLMCVLLALAMLGTAAIGPAEDAMPEAEAPQIVEEATEEKAAAEATGESGIVEESTEVSTEEPAIIEESSENTEEEPEIVEEPTEGSEEGPAIVEEVTEEPSVEAPEIRVTGEADCSGEVWLIAVESASDSLCFEWDAAGTWTAAVEDDRGEVLWQGEAEGGLSIPAEVCLDAGCCTLRLSGGGVSSEIAFEAALKEAAEDVTASEEDEEAETEEEDTADDDDTSTQSTKSSKSSKSKSSKSKPSKSSSKSSKSSKSSGRSSKSSGSGSGRHGKTKAASPDVTLPEAAVAVLEIDGTALEIQLDAGEAAFTAAWDGTTLCLAPEQDGAVWRVSSDALRTLRELGAEAVQFTLGEETRTVTVTEIEDAEPDDLPLVWIIDENGVGIEMGNVSFRWE